MGANMSTQQLQFGAEPASGSQWAPAPAGVSLLDPRSPSHARTPVAKWNVVRQQQHIPAATVAPCLDDPRSPMPGRTPLPSLSSDKVFEALPAIPLHFHAADAPAPEAAFLPTDVVCEKATASAPDAAQQQEQEHGSALLPTFSSSLSSSSVSSVPFSAAAPSSLWQDEHQGVVVADAEHPHPHPPQHGSRSSLASDAASSGCGSSVSLAGTGSCQSLASDCGSMDGNAIRGKGARSIGSSHSLVIFSTTATSDTMPCSTAADCSAVAEAGVAAPSSATTASAIAGVASLGALRGKSHSSFSILYDAAELGAAGDRQRAADPRRALHQLTNTGSKRPLLGSPKAAVGGGVMREGAAVPGGSVGMGAGVGGGFSTGMPPSPMSFRV